MAIFFQFYIDKFNTNEQNLMAKLTDYKKYTVNNTLTVDFILKEKEDIKKLIQKTE